MNDLRDRLVLILGPLCLLLLLLGCVGWKGWFGVGTLLLIFLCAALGFGGSAARREVLPALLAMFAAGVVLMVAILLTDRTDSSPDLVLGVPVATAFLIYGIWPLGVFIGVLYFRVFDRLVLPSWKLDKFLSEFGRRTSSD